MPGLGNSAKLIVLCKATDGGALAWIPTASKAAAIVKPVNTNLKRFNHDIASISNKKFGLTRTFKPEVSLI